MPIASPTSLSLNAVRSAARTHVASQGATASNLYIHDALYRAGEVIQPKRDHIVIPVDCVMVFADDEPLMNWGIVAATCSTTRGPAT
jgi:hypothetical protein